MKVGNCSSFPAVSFLREMRNYVISHFVCFESYKRNVFVLNTVFKDLFSYGNFWPCGQSIKKTLCGTK